MEQGVTNHFFLDYGDFGQLSISVIQLRTEYPEDGWFDYFSLDEKALGFRDLCSESCVTKNSFSLSAARTEQMWEYIKRFVSYYRPRQSVHKNSPGDCKHLLSDFSWGMWTAHSTAKFLYVWIFCSATLASFFLFSMMSTWLNLRETSLLLRKQH